MFFHIPIGFLYITPIGQYFPGFPSAFLLLKKISAGNHDVGNIKYYFVEWFLWQHKSVSNPREKESRNLGDKKKAE